jgi:hypothetical protein
MRDSKEKFENLRSEYAAIVSFHENLLTARFTIAGLYLTAVGVMIGFFHSKDYGVATNVIVDIYAILITFCLWILEFRNRSLLDNITDRGIDIERNHWLKIPKYKYVGFFSRQRGFESDSKGGYLRGVVPKPPVYLPKLFWGKVPKWFSPFVSHSVGLDVLYLGSLVMWTLFLGNCLCQNFCH